MRTLRVVLGLFRGQPGLPAETLITGARCQAREEIEGDVE